MSIVFVVEIAEESYDINIRCALPVCVNAHALHRDSISSFADASHLL